MCNWTIGPRLRWWGRGIAMAATLTIGAPPTAGAQSTEQAQAKADVQEKERAAARAAEAKEQAHPAEPDWFLEPTYAAPMFGSKSAGSQGTPVVEIQSFHHVPMFPRQNSGRYQYWINAENNEAVRTRKRFALTLGTIIRGHDGPSVPIQTPSIIFAGRGQYLRHKVRNDVSDIRVFELGIYHHSNGQDGCTFVTQQRIDDECQPALEPAPDDWVVNTKDGSFGVNYVSSKIGWSRRTRQPLDDAGSREVRTAHNLHVEYRRYVTWIPGGSGIRQIARRFGRNEVEGQWQWEVPSWPTLWRLRHYQLTARGWRRFGSDATGAGGASGELAWLGFAGGVAGPFVRVYRGSDYYNIRFEEQRRHLLVGLKWDRPRLARFPAAVK